MFQYKTTRQQLLDEKRKNEVLTAQNIELTNALLELAKLLATHDDAIVEIAEIAEIVTEVNT